MDVNHSDCLARSLAGVSRRALVGGLLAGVVAPLQAAAKRGKGQGKQRKHRQDPRRVHAQQEDCWRAGACLPKKGANLSYCDLEDSTAFNGWTAPAAT